MKTSDVLYIGTISILAYLLLKKNKTKPTSTIAKAPVGHHLNNGLMLGTNMDLPNLTPTPPDGVSTEVALNNGGVSTLIKDDEENVPVQVFGLPIPLTVISTTSTSTAPDPIITAPIGGTSPYIDPNTYTAPSELSPITSPSHQSPSVFSGLEPVSSVGNGTSIVAEPIFTTNSTDGGTASGGTSLIQPLSSNLSISDKMDIITADKLIADCGNAFSIANPESENSYTNYWIQSGTYYMQTVSPAVRSVPVNISKDQYLKGCQAFQMIRIQKAI